MATASPAQGELLNYNPESPDWVAVKILIDEVEEEIAARRSHLLFRVKPPDQISRQGQGWKV